MKDPACGLRLSAAGLAGSAAHPPLRGRPQKRRRTRAVQKISRISLKEYRRAAAEQKRHPCTKRRQPDVLRAGLWASGRPARREARAPVGQHKDSAPSRSAQRGKECDLRKSRSFSAGRCGVSPQKGSGETAQRVWRQGKAFPIGPIIILLRTLKSCPISVAVQIRWLIS